MLPNNIHTSLLAFRGSLEHGTFNAQTDDIDLMGVVIPPLDYYLGNKSYGSSRGTWEINKGSLDIVYYELGKFISLLGKGNPNVIGLLWADNILVKDSSISLLMDLRGHFITKQLLYSFLGYINGQIKLIERERTGNRKELVDKFGYDTKAASHIARLLFIGIQIFDNCIDNELISFQLSEDKLEIVLDIKNGKYNLQNFTFYVLERYLPELEEFKEESIIPNKCMLDAKELTYGLLVDHFKINR